MMHVSTKKEQENIVQDSASEAWKKHLHALGIKEADIKELEEFNRKLIETMPKENN